jgi:hypothetical protein
MKKRPTLSTKRAVEIFEDAVDIRRGYCADTDFFRMTEFWEYLCEDSETWSIKRYRSGEKENFKRKAGVIAFAGLLTLTVDQELWDRASKGNLFFNYLLAHEAGHLILNHHAKGAVTKHFELYAGPNFKANIPATVEELEANYAATFFQCGVALLEPRWEALELARRAFSDPYHVEKLQAQVRLDAFRRLLNRPRPKRERVVF